MESIKKFLRGIKPRKYQEAIFETCNKRNCLVVLPTGLGKSLVGVMLAIQRFKEYPDNKILILAPTKPLAIQWLSYFKKHTHFLQIKAIIMHIKNIQEL